MSVRLPEFFRPISDDALPDLRDQLHRGARTLSLACAVVAPLAVASDWPHAISLGSLLGMMAADAGAFLAVWAIAGTAFGRRRPDAALLMLAVVLACGSLFAGLPLVDGHNPVPYLPLVLTAFIAMFAPWRPTLSMLLTAAVGAAWAVAALLLGTQGLDVPSATAVLVLCGALSAVSNQVNRRLWARLESTRASLAAADRMYSLGRLTAGIAHEVKTPLAASMSALKSAHGLVAELHASAGHPDVTPDDLRAIARDLGDAIAMANDANQRISTFVLAIRSHTRLMNTVESVPVNVAACVDGVRTLVSHRTRDGRVVLDFGDIDPTLVIEGDPGKLDQILTNLIGNALDACLESGIGTRVRVAAHSDGDDAVISVVDDGPGVPVDLAERIFDPLFTTRGSGLGSGLGLAIARDLAEGAFRGRLTLQRGSPGATFVLRCPRTGTTAGSRPAWNPAQAA
jgi:signal transduction histidine kinase